jgi:uncharacterized protein
MEFVWDPRKEAANRRKHGVSFDEALTVFADPMAQVFDDPDHSAEEAREIIIGHSARHRLLIVCFTERGGAIRIIGARAGTRGERQRYEENVPKA